MEEKKNSPFSTITINKDMLNDLESHQWMHDRLMRTKTVTWLSQSISPQIPY